MIIDAHHHLWRLSRGDYDWLTPNLAVLYRDFEPADLAPLMAASGVAGGIVVQAAPTEAETRFLLDFADRTPTILGVVGWTDFASRDAPGAIARLAGNLRLKGVRPMLQDLADDDFILRPEADRALRAMGEVGLRFEALIRPRHLSRLLAVRERHPDLPIILNHAAKPDIAGGAWEPWASDLRRLAADGRTICKLSGLITEAGKDWSPERLRPYVDHVIEAFGPRRVMWGSDWPVLLLAGTHGGWLETARELLSGLTHSEQAAILGGNAARVYGLDEPEMVGADGPRPPHGVA
jgi:L-fuconolactonase